MLKNVTGQKFHVIAFNAAGRVSGAASAITCTLAIDGGDREDLNDVNPVEIGSTGVYVFDLTISETDGHELSFVPACSTAGVQVLGLPSNVIYTETPVSDISNAVVQAIGATADELAQGVATRLSAIQLSVQQQITILGGTQLSVVQGDDYTRVGVRIDLDTSGLPDPDEDLSGYKFVIAIQAANVFGVRMSIEGDPGEHYVTFSPASTVTETWPIGRYNCLYRLEIDENKYETIGVQGVIEITPFDIDENQIVDIDVV